MRRFWIVAIVIAMCAGSASADNDRPITFEQLPKGAQTLIKKHFADATIQLAKEDPGILGSEYDVVFSDGTKVEFNDRGQWESIKCRNKALPTAVVPQPIADYVKKHYPTAFITSIDRDARDYEVELNTGVELTFNMQFHCIDIDY